MTSIVNTNLVSLNAQRNLSTNQSSLATSVQRLSSGLRINSAKDDAAGLAISDRFTAQIRGLKLERVRLLQDMDSLLARSRRFLQEESPEMFPPAEVTRKFDEREAARLDQLEAEVRERLMGTGAAGS